MKKKLLLSVAAAVAVLSSSISVCAAPQYMADGAVFDPEWYQEKNPEVAEALKSLGLDVSADTLYQHYTLFGAKEDRTPYDKEHFDLASVLPYQGAGADTESAAQTQPAASPTQFDDSEIIIAVDGVKCTFPSIHSRRYNYENCTVNITFNKAEFSENGQYYSDYMAAYTLPGYEWRKFNVSAYSTPGSYYMYSSSTGDFLKAPYFDINYDKTDITNVNAMWETLDENGWVTHVATFTVTQDGTEYPDCQLFTTWNWSNAGEASFSWYALVPKNFSGGLAAGYRGATLENGKAVEDKSSPLILFEF